jgi:hypothetical protein
MTFRSLWSHTQIADHPIGFSLFSFSSSMSLSATVFLLSQISASSSSRDPHSSSILTGSVVRADEPSVATSTSRPFTIHTINADYLGGMNRPLYPNMIRFRNTWVAQKIFRRVVLEEFCAEGETGTTMRSGDEFTLHKNYELTTLVSCTAKRGQLEYTIHLDNLSEKLQEVTRMKWIDDKHRDLTEHKLSAIMEFKQAATAEILANLKRLADSQFVSPGIVSKL